MDKSGREKRGSCRGFTDRRSPVAVLVAVALLVQACGEPPPPAEPVVRPVRYVTAQATGGQRTRTFSGVARAGFESSLSFRVAGTIAGSASRWATGSGPARP